jgi:hypothetical protein
MRLTILSQNLPGQSQDAFSHEFHEVHAKQTHDIAANTGILQEYIQGFSPILNQQLQDVKLPLSKQGEQLISAAQLTWPSVGVMRSLFGSKGYKSSAGAHIFAKAQTVYVTDNLEAEVQSARRSDQVRMFCLLRPLSENTFQSEWSRHREFVHSLSLQPELYQRHTSCSLSRQETDALFSGTQFAVGEGNIIDGGIDEYVFSNAKDLEEFLKVASTSLNASYKSFVDEQKSSAMMFDQTIVYGAEQRGVYQLVVGSVLSTALSLKDYLRI